MAELIPSVLISWIGIILICQVGFTLGSNDKRYDDFKIFQVIPETQNEIELLRALRHLHTYKWISFWHEPHQPGVPVNLMVSPDDADTLTDILHSHNVYHQLHIDNLQRLIDSNRRRDGLWKRGEYNFEHYQTYDEIVEYMNDLDTLYSSKDPTDLNILSFHIATSYENRPITALKIGSGESQNKPVIWMMAGLHSREWIGPATLMYIARQLAKDWPRENGKDKDNDVLREFDWHILPVLNRDGYVYTWTTDRLWRKTRSLNTPHADKKFTKGCLGVDPNRNWDYKWNEGGNGHHVCDDNFAGTKAFSETEVQQLSDYLLKLNKHNRVVGFLDVHSYGQMWMSPFGYSDVQPIDYDKHMQLANITTGVLSKINGRDYRTGSIARVICSLRYETLDTDMTEQPTFQYTVPGDDKASGNSVDWAYKKLGAEYSYAVELPDTGAEGFLLSPDHITSVGEETYAAVKEMAKLISQQLKSKTHGYV